MINMLDSGLDMICDSGIDDSCLSRVYLTPSSSTRTPTKSYTFSDPVMTQLKSPDFNKFASPYPLCDFETSDRLFDVSTNLTSFMDAMPLLNDSLSSGYSPNLDLCSEPFLDLRHTSTPKSVTGDVQAKKVTRKRIKFEGEEQETQSRSWHVLHDITDQNIMRPTNSFVKISDSWCKSADEDEENCRTPLVRKVPILRGNARKSREQVSPQPQPRVSATNEFKFPSQQASVRERDKWLYYTGFSDYQLMLGVISHVSVPSEPGLSSFQILVLTLMRLRLELDWRDLSHRFNLFVPIVYKLFHSTLSLLSYCLSDMVPWTLPVSRTSTGLFYLQTVHFKNSDSKKIYVLVSNCKMPIVYVSPVFPEAHLPLNVLPSLHDYFLPNDHVCIQGLSAMNIPTFFRIGKSGQKLSFKYAKYESDPDKINFLKQADDVVRCMKQYKLLCSKVSVLDKTMEDAVFVACALTNIKIEKTLSDKTLKSIYKKSCRAPISQS